MRQILFLLLVIFSLSANAAKPIAVTNVSGLVIGTVVQGDSALVIPCGTAETAANASFAVTGQASTIYTITLPASATLTLAASTLTLINFQSFPAAGANGLLDAAGKQTFFVGATLSAIPSNQAVGAYTGTFTVNVLY